MIFNKDEECINYFHYWKRSELALRVRNNFIRRQALKKQ